MGTHTHVDCRCASPLLRSSSHARDFVEVRGPGREKVKAASLESLDMLDGWMDGWVCVLIATVDTSAC